MTPLPKILRNGPALVYPMPDDAALNTYDRIDFFHRRYLNSDTYRAALSSKGKEVAAFYAHALWVNSANQTPVGTIPADTDAQAFMVGMGADVKRWRTIAPDALEGFRPVVTKEGEPMARLANETMLSVCYAGWKRQLAHLERAARNAATQRRTRLKEKMRDANLPVTQAQSLDIANLYLAYFDAHDLNCTVDSVRLAHRAINSGWAPARSGPQLVGGTGML